MSNPLTDFSNNLASAVEKGGLIAADLLNPEKHFLAGLPRVEVFVEDEVG